MLPGSGRPATVERVDARPFLPGVPDLGDGPDVQLWPHLHGTDAMYLEPAASRLTTVELGLAR